MPNTCQMPVANWRRRCSTGSQGRLARRAIARLAVATTLIWQARCRAPTERQTPASPSLRPASVLLRRATPTTTAHRSRTLPAPRARTPPARPSHGASWAPSAAPCATDRYPATAAGAGNAPSGFPRTIRCRSARTPAAARTRLTAAVMADTPSMSTWSATRPTRCDPTRCCPMNQGIWANWLPRLGRPLALRPVLSSGHEGTTAKSPSGAARKGRHLSRSAPSYQGFTRSSYALRQQTCRRSRGRSHADVKQTAR
jgi:hypothetical protein